MSPSFPREFQPTVLKNISHSTDLHLRGYHTLWRPFPGDFNFIREECIRHILQPHISCCSHNRIRFGLCRFHSPLLTVSQLVSLPALTKMFQSRAFPILTDRCLHIRMSYSEIPGSKVPCTSPGLIAAWHVLHQRLSRAIHQMV